MITLTNKHIDYMGADSTLKHTGGNVQVKPWGTITLKNQEEADAFIKDIEKVLKKYASKEVI